MVYRHLKLLRKIPYTATIAAVFFSILSSCKGKIDVAVNSGSSTSASRTSSDIANQVTTSLGNRSLDKSRSATVAAAAGKAGSANAGTTEAQAKAALAAAIQAIYEQFTITSDVSSAMQASFEGIAAWLTAQSSPKTPALSIKSATNSVLIAIAANSSSASDPKTTAAVSGIFSHPSDVTIDGNALVDYGTAVMSGIVSSTGSAANLNEIVQNAVAQFTTSMIQIATSANTVDTIVAALLKGITNAGSSLTSENAKIFLDLIAKNTAAAIAASTLSATAKADALTALKAATSAAVDNLASQGTIPNATVSTYKSSLASTIDTAGSSVTPTATPTATPTPTPAAAEINIKQASMSLTSGSGTQSFGTNVAVGGTADLTFTIENSGGSTLNITGTPKVALSGTNAAEFSVTSQPAASVAAGGTQTFIIRFAPTSSGAKSATVTVANSDSDEGTYTFSITGTAVTPAPEINIKQGSTSLVSGSGSQSFGSVVANSATADVTFTVENTGTATLNLSGTPKAALSGADAGMFSVTAQPAATVAASSTTSFTIRFTPTSTGAKSATVTVANDDSDEGTYTFTITGTGSAAPTMNSNTGNPSIFNQTVSPPSIVQSWSNLSNVVAMDGAATASATVDDIKIYTGRLELTGFGFSSTVPSNATITGIQVEINRRGFNLVNSATCRDLIVKLIVGGTPTGVNLANTGTDWPTTHASAFYGDSTSLWTLTPSAADVRASDFGVAITAQSNLPNGTGSCTADIEYVKMTAYYTPDHYRIFTTSTTYTGNLGGLTGADAKCQARATAASLTGTWKALLSDATTSANTRLNFATGIDFINMVGALIATSSTDLWDNTIGMPVNLDESGNVAGASETWTGSNPNGSLITPSLQSCTSWTSASNGSSGMTGIPSDNANPIYWISWSPATCDGSRAIMCVNQ